MNNRKTHRSGFTLLEISVVLAILVVVGAIAVPMFTGTLQIERLRKGVELVAADWVSTRAKAMETGETQVWVCQVGNNSYSSSTYASADGLTPSEASSLVTESTGLSTTSGSATGGSDFGQSMPAGVSISDVMVTEGDTIATLSQSTMAEGGAATIFFYPDGSSSSARLSVVNEQERTMTVVMNGLSGTVRVLKSIGGGTQ
jgi:prepilin-type N-terminal cleavage/methylation domain-containing protein